MRGSSAESLAALRERQIAAIADGADAAALADDLFGATRVFREQVTVRRAATDPTSTAEARADLVRSLFAPHLGETATDIVAAAGGSRWVRGADLVDALEQLAVVAVARAADAAGEADRLEGELFAFDQTISDHPELREALTDRARSVADKQALLRSLLEGRACSGTVRLAEQAVIGGHGTVRQAFAEFARIATEARGRLLAVVTVAHPLRESEENRLVEALGRQYGKPVHANVVVDPRVLGGIQVEIGNETIDGTVSTRLNDARRLLAG